MKPVDKRWILIPKIPKKDHQREWQTDGQKKRVMDTENETNRQRQSDKHVTDPDRLPQAYNYMLTPCCDLICSLLPSTAQEQAQTAVWGHVHRLSYGLQTVQTAVWRHVHRQLQLRFTDCPDSCMRACSQALLHFTDCHVVPGCLKPSNHSMIFRNNRNNQTGGIYPFSAPKQ